MEDVLSEAGRTSFFDVQELRETARIANLPCFENRSRGENGRTYSPPETPRAEEQGEQNKKRAKHRTSDVRH